MNSTSDIVAMIESFEQKQDLTVLFKIIEEISDKKELIRELSWIRGENSVRSYIILGFTKIFILKIKKHDKSVYEFEIDNPLKRSYRTIIANKTEKISEVYNAALECSVDVNSYFKNSFLK